MITGTFTVTEQHIKLIQNMWIEYNGYTEFGAPEVDPKRPYGNGDVYNDIANLLEIKPEGEKEDEDDDYRAFSDKQESMMLQLHMDTAKALAIMVQHLGITPGKYEQHDYYKWNPVGQ